MPSERKSHSFPASGSADSLEGPGEETRRSSRARDVLRRCPRSLPREEVMFSRALQTRGDGWHGWGWGCQARAEIPGPEGMQVLQVTRGHDGGEE
jgi:hypothetical protein